MSAGHFGRRFQNLETHFIDTINKICGTDEGAKKDPKQSRVFAARQENKFKVQSVNSCGRANVSLACPMCILHFKRCAKAEHPRLVLFFIITRRFLAQQRNLRQAHDTDQYRILPVNQPVTNWHIPPPKKTQNNTNIAGVQMADEDKLQDNLGLLDAHKRLCTVILEIWSPFEK